MTVGRIQKAKLLVSVSRKRSRFRVLVFDFSRVIFLSLRRLNCYAILKDLLDSLKTCFQDCRGLSDVRYVVFCWDANLARNSAVYLRVDTCDRRPSSGCCFWICIYFGCRSSLTCY